MREREGHRGRRKRRTQEKAMQYRKKRETKQDINQTRHWRWLAQKINHNPAKGSGLSTGQSTAELCYWMANSPESFGCWKPSGTPTYSYQQLDLSYSSEQVAQVMPSWASTLPVWWSSAARMPKHETIRSKQAVQSDRLCCSPVFCSGSLLSLSMVSGLSLPTRILFQCSLLPMTAAKQDGRFPEHTKAGFYQILSFPVYHHLLT